MSFSKSQSSNGARGLLASSLGSLSYNTQLGALFLAIAGDAVTTAIGVNMMGLVAEAGPVASAVMPELWLGTPWKLSEVAAAYSLAYIAVGAGAVVALSWGREHVRAVPGGRWFTPALAVVFTASTAANVYVMAWWVNYVPDSGWGL